MLSVGQSYPIRVPKMPAESFADRWDAEAKNQAAICAKHCDVLAIKHHQVEISGPFDGDFAGDGEMMVGQASCRFVKPRSEPDPE